MRTQNDGKQTVVYFTNMAQYLNTGMLETNQGSDKGKT